MAGEKRYRKTVFHLEVLSEDLEGEGPAGASLRTIAREIVEGDWSGRCEVVEDVEVDGPAMAKLLIAQGSDPEFFGLDEDGNEVGDGEEAES